ncbi:MAG: hypothetical protein ACLSHG_10750 [Oscillospiraceae bacterium]
MSPEIIDDMVEENKLVSEYAQLMAGMLFPFRGEQLPRPMLMKYARSADQRHAQGVLRSARHDAGSAQRAARRYL